MEALGRLYSSRDEVRHARCDERSRHRHLHGLAESQPDCVDDPIGAQGRPAGCDRWRRSAPDVMIVGIDASNIRAGGGLTHLSSVLAALEPESSGVERVIAWAGRSTLDQLPDRPWLEKAHYPALDRALPHRLLWRWRFLPGLGARCDVLFAPGGTAGRSRTPVVAMSQNLLPFEWRELRRYGWSWSTLRLLLLRFSQGRTFRRADGVIFLTEHARNSVTKVAQPRGRVAVIPHGIAERFRCRPRAQNPLSAYSEPRPLRLLYVSIVDVYKHQWHVAEAVALLRAEGLPLSIDFVGPANPPALRRLDAAFQRLDPAGRFLHYRGPVPYAELHHLREDFDIFVFASSCENMPITLLEGMAAGFPIAAAHRGPTPELLNHAGGYFDPEDAGSIAGALRELAEDEQARAQYAQEAYARAEVFTWERCARQTFEFMAHVVSVQDGSRRRRTPTSTQAQGQRRARRSQLATWTNERLRLDWND
jgi:glycosyltransferase involved in cell wall biosynthesis